MRNKLTLFEFTILQRTKEIGPIAKTVQNKYEKRPLKSSHRARDLIIVEEPLPCWDTFSRAKVNFSDAS